MNGELHGPPPSRGLPAHRLALRRQLLLEEIESPGATVSVSGWRRAWKQRPRRIRLVLAVAIFVLLSAVGTAVGVGINLLAQQERFDEQRERIPGEPKRIGPLVEVTSAPGWSLVAWRSDSGICLDFVVPQSSGGACGFDVRGEPSDTADGSAPPAKHWISGAVTSGPGAATVIDGVVAEEVARVDVVLSNGRVVHARVIEAPTELQANVDFFLVQVPGDAGLVRAFIAYEEAGGVLERRT
jgi:hypothetical protein